MLEKLKARLAELLDDETRGVEERIVRTGDPTRAEEIADLRARIDSYQRLADLAKQRG